MSSINDAHPKDKNSNFFWLLKSLLNLRADTDRVGTIDLIKSNVEFKSANAWTLVFAIFIASIGLNMNSTAVIIGAMLISPLMGPIVGVGFALGTYDFDLLKKSIKNLGAAILISLAASTFYFLISPLSEVQSELLARTRPSFYDVLIAFFGGAAGIVAISRKEKGNAIPGVAIATALMPPLCTAGFSIASRNWSYFFGALYLFIINSVFISISTFLFVRYLKFFEVSTLDEQKQAYINRWITYVALIVLIPSFFMAWYLQKESSFKSHASMFIKQELKSENLYVVDYEIKFKLKDPVVRVSLLGESMTKAELEAVKMKATNYSISPDSVEIHQTGISEKLEKKLGEKLSLATDQTNQMQVQLKKYELELSKYKSVAVLSKKVTDELSIMLPQKISRVYVMNKELPDSEKNMVLVQWRQFPTKSERQKVNAFISQRLEMDPSNIFDVKGL